LPFYLLLLLPMAHFFNTKLRFPHALAVSITVILLFHIGILAFISYQISDIASDFADIRKRYSFHNRYSKIHKNHFHVSLWEQRKYLEDVTQDS
jgi:predicted PurR-regulated permease PerM